MSTHTTMLAPQERVGQLIRSNHRHAFRSGQWGRIDAVKMINYRPCYVIQWNEGHFSDDAATTDFWVVDDESAAYEFAQVLS